MRILLLASGAFAEPTIRRLAVGGHEIPLVVTQPARGSGRGRRPTPTPVRVLADELDLPVKEIENVNDPAFIERVRGLEPRLMLVIAFGQKLGDPFLAAAPGGGINLHASLLPRYRGAAPINWAIVRGEQKTGCTVFRVVRRMDAGPILAQDATAIGPEETAGELHDRLALLGVRTVETALAMFEHGRNPAGIEQDDAVATLAPKLKKSDGYIDFKEPAGHVLNRIRGMTPWPGATAMFVPASGRSELVTIVRARMSGASAAPPSNFGAIDERMRVACDAGAIEILEIQPAGGRVMTWNEFANGRRLRPGDSFARPG